MALDDIDAGAASIRRRWKGRYIGREAELGLLNEVLNAVRDRGAGQLVTLLGEPGVGKARLSLEFERLVRPDAIVLRGRCRLYDDGVPYRPIPGDHRAGGRCRGAGAWLTSIGVGQEVRDVILAMLGRGRERTGGQTHWAVGRVMAADHRSVFPRWSSSTTSSTHHRRYSTCWRRWPNRCAVCRC